YTRVGVLLLDVVLTRPCSSSLFPYTTLFRSPRLQPRVDRTGRPAGRLDGCGARPALGRGRALVDPVAAGVREPARRPGRWRRGRSEEHTSELQSRENLVCRLLLEQKKISTAR